MGLKRVALVYPFYPPVVGGVETRMYSIARGLSKRNLEVHVITSSLKKNKEQMICSHGIYLHRCRLPLSYKWPYWPEWALEAAPLITNIIRKFDIQVIDAQDCTSLMASFWAKALIPSLRIIFTLHEAALNFHNTSLQSQIGFFINYLNWDAMVVPSNHVERQARMLAQTELPIFRIYNGVNIAKFSFSRNNYRIRSKLDIKRDQKVLLCPSRISPDKGIIFIIKALHKISKAYDTKLIITGDGASTSKDSKAYYRNLVSEIRNLQLTDRVLFCNGSFSYEEMPYLYSVSDIVILPSTITEGFGNSVVEGMASCKPVIATRVGAVPEIINDGENGILVEPRNSDMIADAVLRLLRDERLHKRLRNNGRRDAASRFSLDRLVDELIHLYSKILDLQT